MKAFFYLLLCLYLFNACQAIEPKISENQPDDLIEKSKIKEMIYEVKLLQAAFKSRSNNDTMAIEKRNARMIQLLKKYNTTQLEFESSLAYYHQSPTDMEDIYGAVVTKLNLKITQLEEKID